MTVIMLSIGFPLWLSGKEFTCSAGDMDWEDTPEKEVATHPSILAWTTLWTEGSIRL